MNLAWQLNLVASSRETVQTQGEAGRDITHYIPVESCQLL